MRIVQCCPYDMLRPGGVQKHIRDLSSWLRLQGHEVVVVAPPSTAGGPVPVIRHLGRVGQVAIHGTVSEISHASGRELARFAVDMREWGAELLHLHTPWTPMLPWQIWRRLDLPTVVTIHATLPPDSGLTGRAIRAAARYFMSRVEAAIVPSISPLDTLGIGAGTRAPVVLPPAIDLSPWRKAASRRNDATNRKRAAFVGRLEERKGVGVLLDAWRIVFERMPTATLTIAGGGRLEASVRAALDTRWGRSMSFVKDPDDEEVRRIVGRSDILVAPSLYGESFGIVLVEAMATGAVPVAAANSGYATVMTGDGAVLLVPPGDAAALAARLLDLARDEGEIARLRKWGETHAAEFDIEAVGPRYEALLGDVLEVAGKPTR
jgi:phosphatidylinositol alpha-mannosyltransferase